ncbi:ATP-dependent zinc metalloprotease FtsH [Geobacter hydrogenophilus]|uniref:ATP-dependent zinc metalloprotease FtsH n=1 Tax=Geobacter hydrogenophilus TaxID=40983 RepID=A0A9W6G2I7_9BACT|nr:ATP-dependent zinc metalloprotease FtsH [Geobacter hydrogenophilus]MBT0892345.1 ATP-dependent zinc metalloprotease FtsH [Geobacter hydrogenophilus]GLI39739.1 ATP-dependent zinc metalloprotease FtsH [Geobacter hydrogenophilus]
MGQSVWKPLIWVFVLIIVFNFVYGYFARQTAEGGVSISYSRFKDELAADNIKKISLKGNSISGEFRNKVSLTDSVSGKPVVREVTQFTTIKPAIEDPSLMADLQSKKVDVTAVTTEVSPLLSGLLYLLPWILIIGVWWLAMRGMRGQSPGAMMGGFAKSGAQMYTPGEKSRVTFDDVAGMENAKLELREIVDYLRDPKKFQQIGGKVPKGVLLVGPPGTGKTLLARAVAGEAGVTFLSITASQFIEMFVGVGAGRVRDLFATAKKSAPSIIFIDEIDAVGRSRGAGLGGGHDEREQTLNQLLSEMDGFDPHDEVIVMAATNRPDVLDAALLRPGRFDRHVVIDRPDWRDREKILQVHTRKIPMDKDVSLAVIARGTPGMTGADLENLVNEAAILAARENSSTVTMDHLERAKDKVLMGGERKMYITDQEKRITAYHEAGHTLVAKLLPGTDPVHKVTIIPRGQALGVTQQLPEDDRYHYSKTYLVNRLSVALGGRVAERLVFGDLSTGAQNDLKMVNDLAEKMVCQWGMSDKIGAMTFRRGEEHPFLGRKLAEEKTFSEQMAWLIDQEIAVVIKEAEAKAEEIIAGNRDKLDILVDALIEEETLDGKRINGLLGLADRQ